MILYDAKMDVMDTSDNSWFECFINPVKVEKLIADPSMKKVLPRLCIQFTEKGFLAEKEKDKAKLGIEELNLFERKAASMRLCAMAAFAALDWDIDYIIDNITRYELLTLRVLADHTYKIYNERNLDATFGNWLFYRFVLSIDRRNRLPPPAPKATIPTIYNQITSNDMALIRHDKVHRMITELREHVPKARAFMTELSEEPRDVSAPGINCFLKPFTKLAPRALHAALLGDRDVLVEIPSCDFEIEKIVIPAGDVANKSRSELVTLCFTAGELEEAKKILESIIKPTTSHPFISIDEKLFKSYCIALHVTGPFATAQNIVIKPMLFDQKILSDDQSIYRKSELMRERAIRETSGQLKMVYQAENAAKSLTDGHAECVREKITSKATIERFVKVLKRHLDGMKNMERIVEINGYLQFLCATIFELRGNLERNGHDVKNLRDYAKPSSSSNVQHLPTSQSIDAILHSNDAFWKIVTKFNLQTLRDAIKDVGAFWFPNTMPHSEFLNDIVTSTQKSSNHMLMRLLLAKLEQLSRLRNYEAFKNRLQEYFPEMRGSSNFVILATFEAIHVYAAIGNRQCILPYERRLLNDVNADQTSLIFKPDFKPTENSAKMINQCMALLLNLGEFKTVLEKGGHIPIDQFPCVPIARLLGAYASNTHDANMTRKCADGFSHTNSPKFVAAQLKSNRRGNDGVLVSDVKLATARRDITLMMHLFDLIRQSQLVEFILAYIASLHNRVVVSQRKPHLKIHAKLLSLFASDNLPIEIQNNEDIRQCLRMMCVKAYAILRTDPDTIRTYADFLFVEGNYQAAAEKYLEFFAAHSPIFSPQATDALVFQDTLLHRLRLCLAHSGYLTLSMLTCQFMKNAKQNDYSKAMTLLRANLTRDVGPNCSELVWDVNAIEMLSTVYHAQGMIKGMTTLYTGASSLSANKNTPSVLVQQEINRRTHLYLETLASIFFGTHS